MPNLSTYPITDLRIRVDVQERLRRAPELQLSEIQVDVDHGEVRLGGVVWPPAATSMAVAIAAAVEGVELVHDNLEVRC